MGHENINTEVTHGSSSLRLPPLNKMNDPDLHGHRNQESKMTRSLVSATLRLNYTMR